MCMFTRTNLLLCRIDKRVEVVLTLTPQKREEIITSHITYYVWHTVEGTVHVILP